MKKHRLSLKTETIRTLSHAELERAGGGMTIQSFDYQCPASWWDVNCKPSGIDVCPMEPTA